MLSNQKKIEIKDCMLFLSHIILYLHYNQGSLPTLLHWFRLLAGDFSKQITEELYSSGVCRWQTFFSSLTKQSAEEVVSCNFETVSSSFPPEDTVPHMCSSFLLYMCRYLCIYDKIIPC